MVVFFVLLMLNCANKSPSELQFIYNSEKVVGVTFPSTLATNKAKVYLKSNLNTAVLGNFSLNRNTYTFEPIVPFFKGNTYLLYQNNKEVSRFTIDKNDTDEAPEVIAIYPSTDKLPENLLKMYFLFSKPMQEVGNALDFISITNHATGETVNIFLELTTELWNNEHTQLTLWLDPGRIKTDLIPNKELGLPILKGNTYTLKIDGNWQDANGNSLNKSYEKVFNVVDRDSEIPLAGNWGLLVTPDVLTLHFNEPLDGILGTEVFSIKNARNMIIKGKYELINNEKTLKFNPNTPFAPGEYSLIVESKLEDLAGNNLNHPFDNDLTQKAYQNPTETKTLQFTVN